MRRSIDAARDSPLPYAPETRPEVDCLRTPKYFALAALSVLVTALSHANAAAAELECPGVQASTLATINTGGEAYPSALVEMRLRPDGRPVILYSGGPRNAQTARVINCHDSRCNSFDDTVLSSAFNYADAFGLAISADGRPLILSSHYGRLTYFECANERCSLSHSVQIDPVFPGRLRTLLVRPDGRPQLIYAKGGSAEIPYDIVSYTCTDSRCASGVSKTLVDVLPERQLTLGATSTFDSEGRLVMSYLQNDGDYSDTDFQVLRCDDPQCATLQTRTVSSEPGYRNALFAWMHLLSDDRPLLMDDLSPSMFGKALMIECADGSCEEAITTDLPSSPDRRLVGINVHGINLPLMGTLSETTAGFYVCQDPDCVDVQLLEAAANQPFFNSASLQMGPQTRPLLAYFDEAGTELRLLQCNSLNVFADGFD
jgi:hypothetical protein